MSNRENTTEDNTSNLSDCRRRIFAVAGDGDAQPRPAPSGRGLLRFALRYAERGLLIFPVPPGTKKSYKSADHSDGRAWGMTSDADEICRDFTRWPHANIGLPTGAINQIVIIETDTKAGGHAHDGEPALRELETRHGPLPETLQAISPSGSVHRYFRHPGDGLKIVTSAGEIGAGIDVRGDGGMVIVPPSVRHDGTYRWLNHNPIPPMPTWLVELTRDKPPISQRATVRRPIGAMSAYAAAALKNEIDALSNALDGHRNAALNLASFNLHQLVGAGELDGAEVEHELIRACEINGLMVDRDNGGPAGVLATIKSGARAGLQRPRGQR
jgi:putative DNA primase/helicase